MLAKVTSKNQLTLPKSVTNAIGPVEYFDVEAKDGQIILTPVRIQRADAVRAKPDSSMRVAVARVAAGEGDAVVSAGNSGAMLACIGGDAGFVGEATIGEASTSSSATSLR